MTRNARRDSALTGHVGLNVSDLTRSKEFYQTVFGLDLLVESHERDRKFAFLGHDGEPVVTLWEQSSGRFERGRPGLHHLSFRVDEVKEVEAAEKRLRSLDVPHIYDGIVAHRKGSESVALFFEDPDGIRLEISAPNGGHSYEAPTAEAPACGFF